MKKLRFSVFAVRKGSTYAVVEDRLVERRDRDREVLLDTGQVDEAYVDHLDAFVLDELEQLVAVLEHSSSLAARAGAGRRACGSTARCGAAPDSLKLRTGRFLTVSGLFRPCNRCPPGDLVFAAFYAVHRARSREPA